METFRRSHVVGVFNDAWLESYSKMTSRKIFYTTVLLLNLFILATSTVLVSAQSTDQYLYLVSQNGQLIGKSVDPGNPNNVSNLFTTSLSNNSRVYDAIISPDGQWVTIIPVAGASNSVIKLVNTNTGSTRDITVQTNFMTSMSPSLLGLPIQVIWSPNSQLLAFISYDAGNSDVFLYSVSNNTTTNLTADQNSESQLAWSSDSSQLAVMTEKCANINSCSTFIEVYNVAGANRTGSVEVGSWGAAFGPGSLCHLSWSPDGQYLSFVSVCDSSLYATPKELYILNVAQSTYVNITNYTLQARQDQDPLYTYIQAAYNTQWLDSQTLLIGAMYLSSDLNTTTTISAIYNVSSNSFTVINNTEMGQDWSLNPVSREIAFRTSVASYLPNNSAIKVGNITGNTLSTSLTVNAGCDLSWSPTGQFLAFANRGNPLASCENNVQSLAFVEKSTGQVREYAISGGKAFPIGWISLDTGTPANTPAPATLE
jgi:dipeptidyl aminopeptidase/acylaminoacyl peptidase